MNPMFDKGIIHYLHKAVRVRVVGPNFTTRVKDSLSLTHKMHDKGEGGHKFRIFALRKLWMVPKTEELVHSHDVT